MATNPSSSYDGRTIALHWGSAALILLLWLAGQFLDIFPKGTPRITVRSMHICLGVLLGLALAYRIWWRNHGGTQFPLDGGVRHEKLAHRAHRALYAVIGLLVVSGIALVWIRGDNLFNLVSVPAFDPGNKELRHNAKEVHGWIADSLLLGATLHGVMAIWHQIVLKDSLLRRMVPRI
jgi:cytochrome b561